MAAHTLSWITLAMKRSVYRLQIPWQPMICLPFVTSAKFMFIETPWAQVTAWVYSVKKNGCIRST